MVDLIDFRERVIELARKKARLNDSSSSSSILQLDLKSKTQRLALERSILTGIDYSTSYAETEEAIERRIEEEKEEDVDNRLNTKKVVVIDGGDVCSICLQDINTPGGGDCGDARVLNCSHTFHWRCISEWRKLKTNCPLCRHDMEKEQQQHRRRTVKQKKNKNQIIVIT